MQTSLTLKTREELDEGFIRDFVACAARVRQKPFDAYATSEAYVRMLMQLERRSAFVLMREQNEIVGRACVFVSSTDPEQGALGLYDISLQGDHRARATRLLAECVAYAKSIGLKKLIGPLDANTFFNYRFRVDNDPRSFAWEPNQPREYPQDWKAFGFQKLESYGTQGTISNRFFTLRVMSSIVGRNLPLVKMRGYTFESFSPVWSENLDRIFDLGTDCFAGNFLYEPLSRAEFDKLYGSMKADFSPSVFVKDPEGKVVGFSIAYYDQGFLVVKTIGTRPSERGKKIGQALAGYQGLKSYSLGYKDIISALTRGGNRPEQWVGLVNKLGVGVWRHSYELYVLEI